MELLTILGPVPGAVDVVIESTPVLIVSLAAAVVPAGLALIASMTGGRVGPTNSERPELTVIEGNYTEERRAA